MKTPFYNCLAAGLLLSGLTVGCSSPTAQHPATTAAPAAANNQAAERTSPDAMASFVAREFGPLRVPIKTVGILLYDGYTPLDAIGPYQVLSEIPGVQIKLIAKHKGLNRDMGG